MKVGFIGGGKMAEAMLDALLKVRVVRASDIKVSDVSASRRRTLSRRHGVSVTAVNRRVVEFAQTVVLAVKPQHLDAVLQDIAPSVGDKHLFISIAAGKRLESITSQLRTGNVVRVMPNLATVVRAAMSAFCLGSGVSEAGKRRVTRLLSAVGDVVELPESQFDAVTALSGSGPAFFAYFLDCMIEAGCRAGLSHDDAERLTVQTFLGTAKVLAEGIYAGPEALMKAVASSKGTTEAGFKILLPSDVADVMAATVKAAAERSWELSQ